MTTRVMIVVAELRGPRGFVHEGDSSPMHVPFCGLAVVEALAGIDRGVGDPFATLLGAMAGQELNAIQRDAIDAARSALVGRPWAARNRAVSEVRHATPADVPALTRTFARAFADDSVFCWLYRDEATRYDGLAALFTVAVQAGLRRGHTYAALAAEAVRSGRLRASSYSTTAAASGCWQR